MDIYCCGCGNKIKARLTDGGEIYPHRNDLKNLPFWKCDTCGNYVGCHHKTKNRTHPLGCIPTKDITAKRKILHQIIDPLWKTDKINRNNLYGMISDELGYRYHTANTKSIEECDKIINIVNSIADKLNTVSFR